MNKLGQSFETTYYNRQMIVIQEKPILFDAFAGINLVFWLFTWYTETSGLKISSDTGKRGQIHGDQL